jgi:hypothetical protein
MNKQELIERIKGLENIFGNKTKYIQKDAVIRLISELDEPQKVTIPQFVADWLNENDLREETLGKQSVFDVFDSLKNDSKNGYYENVKRWIDENRDLFARAWLDGYDVEKEKRYLVKMKGISEDSDYLNYDSIDGEWYLASDIDACNVRTHHTRKELEEAGFGWVFDCPGMEVEEVGE